MIGYYLYIAFVISYFLHLPARIPVLGVIRFDFVLASAVLLYTILFGKENLTEKGNISITTKSLLFLIAYIIISVPFVEWPGSVIRFGLNNYLKVIMFYFFTVWYIDSEDKMKTFIWLFILCQSFRIVEPVFLHVTTGYWGSHAFIEGAKFLDRLSGAPYDVVNPNQFAWVIVTTLAFFYYCGWHGHKVFKIVFLCLLPIFIYALLLTGSRSGLLSLVFLILAIILAGKDRLKRLAVFGVILIALVPLVVGHLSGDLIDRYRSVFDAGAPGRGSVEGRITGIKNTLSTVSNKPIFGHGLGTSPETNYNLLGGRDQPTHNLYIEILQELGTVGFVIFLMYVKEMIRTLIHAKRILTGLSAGHSWLMKPIMATQAWVAMHLFYSISCFGLTSWEWYFFGGVSTVCLKLAKESAQNEGVRKI